MKTKKMRKKEHAKHVQSQYNNLANIRRGEIRKHILSLKGKLFEWTFTCDLCGHQRTKGYLYKDETEEYEICKFCNDALFHKHDYLKIHYTPMGNKRCDK